MPSATKDFALIDVRERRPNSASQFYRRRRRSQRQRIVGRTWKKTNKDGSRDRRFASNYEIPIARDAKIEFRSSSGLHEVYQFSNCMAGLTFCQALTEYQNAVATLAKRSRIHSASPWPPCLGDIPEYAEENKEENNQFTATVPQAPSARFFILDWVMLVLLIMCTATAGAYSTRLQEYTRAAIDASFAKRIPELPTASSVAVPRRAAAATTPLTSSALPQIVTAAQPKTREGA